MVKPIGSSSSQLRGEEERSLSPGNDRSSESKYKGVRKRKWGKWVSEIRLPNSRERIWLGSFDSPEKAARAFDAAQFCLRGHTAKFNFPHAPPQIPDGRTLSPSEIQLAAARFADSSPLPIPPAENISSSAMAESPCGSSSTVQLEGSFNELLALGDNIEQPFMDMLTRRMDSGNFAADYGIFPGFDELNNGFIATPTDQVPGGGADYFADDGLDGGFGQDYYSNCLWNF